MRYDAIVVGSGFGGAVSAARLAERGFKVLVLERGPWWGPAGEERADAASRRAYPRGVRGLGRDLLRAVRWPGAGRDGAWTLNPYGLMELHAFAKLTALVGSGVGGGSLIYTNIMARPPQGFFDAHFPEPITDAEMAPHFARVHAMMRPEPAPDPTSRLAAMREASSAAGLGCVELPELAVAWGAPGATHTNVAGVRQEACRSCGECILGCRYRSKTTLDLTYIPWALARGAEVWPMCEVTGLGAVDGGYRVRYVDHRTGQRWQVDAPRVVMAAGTLGTLRLLLRARDQHRALPRLPRALGHNLWHNGDLLGATWGRRSLGPGAWRGATVQGVVRGRADSGARYLVGDAGAPLGALPLPKAARRALEHVALWIGMGEDRHGARAKLSAGALEADVARAEDAPLLGAIEDAIGTLGEAMGASGAWLNTPWGRGSERLITVHPLGGAAMGADPERSTVDHLGQVHGHPGLFVADGALYPAAPGVPPSMTIAALAERIAAQMT